MSTTVIMLNETLSQEKFKNLVEKSGAEWREYKDIGIDVEEGAFETETAWCFINNHPEEKMISLHLNGEQNEAKSMSQRFIDKAIEALSVESIELAY